MINNDYLTMDELSRVMNYNNEETKVTRDILLFSCLTGLEFSELDIIQVGDFQADAEGKRWLHLYNELPLHFDKILVTPALAKIVDRNIINKNKKDMLFIFPSKTELRKHFWLIGKYCELGCEPTKSTGRATCEHNYEYVSKHDLII